MGTTVALMSVEQFLQLTEDESVRRELHDGQVFELTRPKYNHWIIQQTLVQLLNGSLRQYGRIGTEYPFRPEPEHQLWAADVAFVIADREASFDRESDYLHGSPDLVIEVESPSNTAYEFERRETVCLRSGCKEFWIVYPKSRIVRVATQGQVRRYGVGDVIALSLVDGVSIAVADIFTDAGPSDRRRD